MIVVTASSAPAQSAATAPVVVPALPQAYTPQSAVSAADRALQPAASAVTAPAATDCVTAQWGDTLGKMAAARGITLEQLLALNPELGFYPDLIIADETKVCFMPGTPDAPAQAASVVNAAYEQPAPSDTQPDNQSDSDENDNDSNSDEQAAPEPPAQEEAPAPAPASASVGVRAMEFALTRDGGSYVWGADGPTNFDCSGLVIWSLAQAGLSLADTTADGLRGLPNRDDRFVHVSRGEIQAGDIVFFGSRRAHHVGIATSNIHMINATTADNNPQPEQIMVSNFAGRSNFMAAIRVVA
ncbi:MAG: C40 family peptidase [Pseudomonas sp.]